MEGRGKKVKGGVGWLQRSPSVFAGDVSLMPLDGHAFLLSQGWSGAGEGLRKGAISRPITAPRKKNLAGIGKDRAEAFPFWDQ
jgi:hypothetical protein